MLAHWIFFETLSSLEMKCISQIFRFLDFFDGLEWNGAGKNTIRKRWFKKKLRPNHQE